jgi:putative addiction module CopG family antidote
MEGFMSSTLPPEFEAFVHARVASGAYPSEQAVLRTAFDLLERRERLLEQIDEGTQQLLAGQFTEYGEDEHGKFLADITATAARLDAARTQP